MRALEKLKKAVSMKAARKVVELPDGSEFEFFMTPLTLAERSRAQKSAKNDDGTDFALHLLIQKAKNGNNQPLFAAGEIADLRNTLPASVVESILLQLVQESDEEEELEGSDLKSTEE
jgi:hypothetical protein